MSKPLAMVTTEFLDRPGLAASTVRSYEFTLLPLLQQYGQWSLELLDRQTLEEYLNSLSHLSFKTHHRHQAILQALLNFAVEQGYLRSNPMTRMKRRKPDPAKGEHDSDQIIRYLTPDQLQLQYQLVSKDARTAALVRLLHRTGARISELLSLDLEALDLEQRKFQVIGKGNRQRWCFYSEDAAEVLQKYLAEYRHPGSPALFTAQQYLSDQVNRLSYRSAHHNWKQLIKGHPTLAGTRLHDLRHTFATERVGIIALEELRALMGHQSIQTTLRYQKVTSEQAQNAAQRAFDKLSQTTL
ncbi:tyrosine-type recombinase/integrase [Acaryochloris marina]|uniref:Phage integrase n=2 Tax=Acaryochloris marina (strain MBIC 11017) TaxID=329726 RepID=A8ZLM3_ACAM1|nr:tyrosine-type recombinase/integrase [Acaryochloris marina]ABW32050.1 phage integrase [Acaryochloris marina MBIC11017]BDM83137.1 tyrosine recombinase XerC [Acaryochloris marina MBIC10699]